MKVKPRSEPEPGKLTKGFYTYHVLDSDLQPVTKLVLLAMAEYLPRPAPGVLRLTGDTGLSKNTVKKHLGLATSAGWLELRKKGSQGRGNSHEYRLSLPGYAEYYAEEYSGKSKG